MQKKTASKTIFSFIGPPGCGKGTLAEKCIRDLGFNVLSVGNLCRKHVFLRTRFGKLIDECLQAAKLIPDDLISEVVADWLSLKSNLGGAIILDGYPRTVGQTEHFFKFCKNFLPEYKTRIICFILSDEQAMDRMRKRRICENKDCQFACPEFSLLKSNFCLKCGSKLIKRDDDNPSIAEKRLKKYPKRKKVVLDYCEKIGESVEWIDVENRSMDEVFEDFKGVLD